VAKIPTDDQHVNDPQSKPPALTPSVTAWTVWRIDDNGNRFIVREHLTKQDADRLVAEFEARGHKQTYWAEPDSHRASP
jgi:hypothetical protein